MTYIALTELALIAALVWFLARQGREHTKAILDLITSQEAERQILLDRIQNPGTVVAPARTVAQPEAPPDEIELLRREYERETTNGS